MKNGLLKSAVLGVLAASVLSVGVASAATLTLDGSLTWNGYMNVSEIPANGGGFVFGSSWGTADLTATFSGNVLTLGPNCIGDPNPFWYTPAGGPGAIGNKTMEANMYVEQSGGGPLTGITLTFQGMVQSNTLTAAHVARVFIRDFAPDFSSVNEQSIVLPASGSFSVTMATINDVARHVQYGFQVKGPDVWVTDLAPFGTVVVAPLLATPTQSTTWGKIKAQYR